MSGVPFILAVKLLVNEQPEFWQDSGVALSAFAAVTGAGRPLQSSDLYQCNLTVSRLVDRIAG